MGRGRKVVAQPGAGGNAPAVSAPMHMGLIKTAPRVVTMSATASGATTSLIFEDFCGLLIALGFGTATTQSMGVVGPVTGPNVRNYLASHAGKIKLINYKSDDPDQLANKIKLTEVDIFEQQANHVFDVAADERNTQFQDTLQTIYADRDNVYWNNTTGWLISTSAGVFTSIAVEFEAWFAYRDLHNY